MNCIEKFYDIIQKSAFNVTTYVGTVVLMTTFYAFLKPQVLELHAAAILGVICFDIGFYCILTIPETHDKDLDFTEPE